MPADYKSSFWSHISLNLKKNVSLVIQVIRNTILCRYTKGTERAVRFFASKNWQKKKLRKTLPTSKKKQPKGNPHPIAQNPKYVRGGVQRKIPSGQPQSLTENECATYNDPIDRPTLKYLRVLFKYLQKKRKKSYRERGSIDAKYIQRNAYP